MPAPKLTIEPTARLPLKVLSMTVSVPWALLMAPPKPPWLPLNVLPLTVREPPAIAIAPPDSSPVPPEALKPVMVMF